MSAFKDLCIKANELQDELEKEGFTFPNMNFGGGLGIDYHHPNHINIPDFENYFAVLQESNFVVVGICGVFSAVLRAPLTGIFLIADVTSSYILLVPLMIVSSVAWFIARLFEPHSIYNKALAESKLLSPDRDRAMLQRFSVRLCLDREFIALDASRPLSELKDSR